MTTEKIIAERGSPWKTPAFFAMESKYQKVITTDALRLEYSFKMPMDKYTHEHLMYIHACILVREIWLEADVPRWCLTAFKSI